MTIAKDYAYYLTIENQMLAAHIVPGPAEDILDADKRAAVKKGRPNIVEFGIFHRFLFSHFKTIIPVSRRCIVYEDEASRLVSAAIRQQSKRSRTGG